MFHTGDQIGTYSLIEKIGRGSFGEVWLAEEKTAISSHRVALKLPNEEDVDLEAIRQEADVWESVKGHPNILPIIKADIFEGQIYIASEYAPDGSLSEWLKKHGGKAPTIETAVRMTRGILEGLAHLHSKGVIHRDLKPANILLQSDSPRIADFGIARLTQATNDGSTLSAGTPSYMAPECFYSIRSEQTDIWAVGVIFHKLLSGKLPFSQPDQVSLMNTILNGEPEIDSEIPEALQQIIRKALQKDPAERYQKAAEIREDLNNFNPALLVDEVTIAENAAPVKPKFEKEEETVVRPKTTPVFIPPVEDAPPNRNNTLIIALASLLVLAAATVWGALYFTGESSNDANTQYSDSSNESNSNFNSTNSRSDTETRTGDFKPTDQRNNLSVPPMDANSSANSNSSGESETIEIPATPYSIKPDETPVNVNKPRTAETPAKTESESPSPKSTPTPAATPIDIAPEPPVKAKPQSPKPTPKPTENSDQQPPALKTDNLDGK